MAKRSTDRGNRAELSRIYIQRSDVLRARLRDFAAVRPDEYFYELVYCLLTPQSSARNADAVVAELRELNFAACEVDPEPILRSPRHYIRFHRTKARHLLLAKDSFSIIAEALRSIPDAVALRQWLVKNVKGLGMKEASHFLRNIGRNEGLAILDRHILRNLIRYGAIRRMPNTLTPRHYLRVEKRFKEFSDEIRIPIDELDLLFWSMETGEVRK